MDDLPLPDLDAHGSTPADPAPGDEATYDVTLLGFLREQAQAAPRLAQIFGLDEAAAERLVQSAPVVVKRRARRADALAIEKALRSIGADVDVRADRASVRPAPVGFATAPVTAPLAAATGIAQASLRDEPLGDEPVSIGEPPSFWRRIPVAFAVPFLGSGAIPWLLLLTVMFFMVAFTRLAPCIGIFMLPVTGAVYLGLLGIYFGQAAQAGLSDDGARPEPSWSMPNQQDALYRGAALVVATVLLFALPVFLAYEGAAPIWITVTSLVPYVYWPMALTVSALSGSLATLFNPIAIGRGILAGGIAYLAVVVLGFAAFAALSAVPFVALSISPLAALATVPIPAIGVGYVAGVQGYLMGCLVASRPERFESLM